MNPWQYAVLALSTLAAVTLFSGCTGRKTVDSYQSETTATGSAHRAEVVDAEAVYTRDIVLPAVDKISKRIATYESKQQAWQTISGRLYFPHLSIKFSKF